MASTKAANALSQAIKVPVMKEIQLQCADGVKLAGQSWKTTNGETKQRVLALHGWMDNCRSFWYVAPNLLQKLPESTELIALDLPGHGMSTHKSVDGPPAALAEAAFYVAEAVEQLNWSSYCLVGHSMGAAISCLYAAAFPEQVSKLVLLEGAGPLAREAKDVAKHVRKHVESRQKILRHKRPPRVHESLEKAVNVRQMTATTWPGNQYLSEQASREMVLRGTIQVPASEEHPNGGVQFQHDPRLQMPSLKYFVNEQVEALYRDIQCPTALFLAVDGWPFDNDRHSRTLELLKPVVHKTLPGSHHFHADPDTAPLVVDEVAQFLQQY